MIAAATPGHTRSDRLVRHHHMSVRPPSALPVCHMSHLSIRLAQRALHYLLNKFNTRARPLIGFWTISSRENSSKPRATDVCSFTSAASCFLFLSLPFLSHSFYSPSLSLLLCASASTGLERAPFFYCLDSPDRSAVRSVLLCLPLIFVMYIDNYKREGFVYFPKKPLKTPYSNT